MIWKCLIPHFQHFWCGKVNIHFCVLKFWRRTFIFQIIIGLFGKWFSMTCICLSQTQSEASLSSSIYFVSEEQWLGWPLQMLQDWLQENRNFNKIKKLWRIRWNIQDTDRAQQAGHWRPERSHVVSETKLGHEQKWSMVPFNLQKYQF